MQEQPFMFGIMPCPLRNPAAYSMGKLPCITVLHFSSWFAYINPGNGNIPPAFSLPPLCFLYSCHLIAVHRDIRARACTSPVKVLPEAPSKLLTLLAVPGIKVNLSMRIPGPDASPIHSPGLGAGILVRK
jgi:hypothetical protein